MSAATASVADVRTEFTNRDNSRVRKNTGHPQAQCTPMPLPALGTQKIIQGNGTTVGTVISLQCPAKHKLVGKELTCIMDNNSPHWVGGETYCKPLSPIDDHGFRVAVLASIISSGIILLMSMAFLTCCLLDCIKEDKRKKEERESDAWHLEEQEQRRDDSRSRYNHGGRNNNNNNSQEKAFPLWDTCNAALCDNMQPCRSQYFYAPCSCNYGPPPSLAALPGLDYDQPLLPLNLDYCLPQYPGRPLSSCQTTSQIPVAGSGVVWQYGGQHSRLSEANPPLTDETSTWSINSNRNINPKELSIKIISV